MKLVLMILAAILTLVVLVFGAWAAITLNYTYASGERAGYIQKISKRGWICKTWEGELAMANLPGTMPQIFEFTVSDDAVAHEIEQHAGQRVSLGYEQHPGVPTRCFGDTEYFVVRLTPVAESAPMGAPAAAPAPAPAAPAEPAPAAPDATPAPDPAPAPTAPTTQDH